MRVPALVVACLLLLCRSAQADGTPSETCDIEVDTQMSVYMVTVGGVPYRNKRYLTYDDAVRLRDVLVSAGACDRAGPPRRCQLKLRAAGDYAIIRGGVNFDRYAKLRTLKAARKYASKLEKLKLCKLVN